METVIESLEAVTVHVRDIESARKFYNDVLGLKEVAFDLQASRAAFAIPGTETQLTMHVQREGEGGREPGTVSGLVFRHQDPAGALEEIRRRGGTIVNEVRTFQAAVGMVTSGVFADPDGNEFVLRTVRK